MSVHQKLGIISESKVVQKLSLEKNVFTQNCLLNWYSLMKFFFESTILALFEALSLCQFTRYSNFIWIQLIFEQKPCFLGPIKREIPWRNWHYYICTMNLTAALHIKEIGYFDMLKRMHTVAVQRYPRVLCISILHSFERDSNLLFWTGDFF